MAVLKPAIERFLDKISISESGCWEWQGSKTRGGYGRFSFKGKMHYSHRFIYEHYHGKIDSNLSIDHLCNNTACGNPQHLEEVTIKTNILRGNGVPAKNARKTHCKRGHEFTEDNIYWIPNTNSRQCRKCRDY